MFSSERVLLVPQALKTLAAVTALMPAYIISTSYTPYLSALCDARGVPDGARTLHGAEPGRLGDAGGRGGLAARRRRTACWRAPSSRSRTRPARPTTSRRTTSRRWRSSTTSSGARMDGRVSGEMVAAVRPVGGGQKLAALEQIVAAEGVAGGGVMYVGDSITDAPPLEAVKAWGGVSLSFNGNGYAIAAAEFAAASPDAEVQAQLAQAFADGGRDAVEAAVRSWPQREEGRAPTRQGARVRRRRGRGARGARRGLRRRAAERPRRARRSPRLIRPRECRRPPPAVPESVRRSRPGPAPHRRHRLGVGRPLAARQPILTDVVVGGRTRRAVGRARAERRRQVDAARRRRRACGTPAAARSSSSARPSAAWTCARLRERIGHVDVKTEEAFSPRRTALEVVLTGATGTIQVLHERVDAGATSARRSCSRRSAAPPSPRTLSPPARRASGAASCWLAP